jgi:hypothetical protein
MMLPASVELDTMTWRMGADRVMAYVSERLVRVPDRCIIRTELVEDFNDWLARNGHNRWGLETFDSRFGQHQSVIGMGVEKLRTQDLSGLSRRYSPQGAYTPCPARAKVWMGVAFREEEGVRDDHEPGMIL